MDTQELLKRLRRIEIKSSRLSEDIFSGAYRSAFKGRGMSFSEVREYQPGMMSEISTGMSPHAMPVRTSRSTRRSESLL